MKERGIRKILTFVILQTARKIFGKIIHKPFYFRMGSSSPRITGLAQILKPRLEYISRYLQGLRIALKVFSMFVGGNRRWVPLKDTFGSFLGIM